MPVELSVYLRQSQGRVMRWPEHSTMSASSGRPFPEALKRP